MKCVLSAESAILVHFKSVRIVLFVFHCVIVSLLAFCTCHCNLNSHLFHPFCIAPSDPEKSGFSTSLTVCFFTTQIKPLFRGRYILSHFATVVNGFFKIFLTNAYFPNHTQYIVGRNRYTTQQPQKNTHPSTVNPPKKEFFYEKNNQHIFSFHRTGYRSRVCLGQRDFPIFLHSFPKGYIGNHCCHSELRCNLFHHNVPFPKTWYRHF